jgi:hypothetical protein
VRLIEYSWDERTSLGTFTYEREDGTSFVNEAEQPVNTVVMRQARYQYEEARVWYMKELAWYLAAQGPWPGTRTEVP